MTITLKLDSEQEARLRDQAEALGLAPVDYLKRVAGLENPPEAAKNEFGGQTLADVLGDSVGTLDSAAYFGGQSSDLSTRTGKAFAEMLHTEYAQGQEK